MYHMKRFIDMERSPLPIFLLLSSWFVFSSVSYIVNECYISHFCVLIKDLSISFSRVVILQNFETVAFNVLFVYKPTFPVVFC